MSDTATGPKVPEGEGFFAPTSFPPDVVTPAPSTTTATLRAENARLRRALGDIVNANRDGGLAAMIVWMRGRAYAALEGEDGE